MSKQIREGQWGIGGGAVYYLRPDPSRAIWRLDPDSKSETTLGPIPGTGGIFGGFGVDVTGTSIYYTFSTATRSDIALLAFPR